MRQFRITISGTVQGVGFRPFIYRTAKKTNVKGYIKNSCNSVELLIQGEEAEIENFLKTIKNNHPPLSMIKKIDVKPSNDEKYSDFLILKSEKYGESDSVMPPDAAMCDSCLVEIFDETNRRYLYPFTVCTDCGPRFTVIESLPYDRENTTMAMFGLCERCKNEYLDPEDRRFRAEPVCCPDCGPSYELFMGQENTFSENPIKGTAAALDRGKIVVIKGIGGTHLAAGTTVDGVIVKMRKILKRPWKPFAIMARNISEARKIAFISEKEEKLLLSPQRPIVILRKKNRLSRYISPGLCNIGIMLPYSGVHHMLFHYSKEPAFLMTSANVPGEPMAIDNADILSLRADFSLVHNRTIKNRCDDSVIRVAGNNALFIRRSRGFVPAPVDVKDTNRTVLAIGAELDVTSCILKKDRAFLSQYIGNTTRLRTVEYLESAIHNLMELTGVNKPEAIAVDMHPSFNTSALGAELSIKYDVPLVRCQHHFAHAASLHAESGRDKMVCIAADGIGYGSDGTMWGGEIISVDDGFGRVGHLLPQPMPGGDLAARYPARMAAGILSGKYGQSELSEMFSPYFEKDELTIVLKQIEKRFNSPLTSSAGRILDAVSAILGVCTERTYEGEPAMKLEAFAEKGKDNIELPFLIEKRDGMYIFYTTELIGGVYLLKDEHPLPDIAASAQGALARGLSQMATRAARDKNIDVIGFSGGVAYNDAIVKTVRSVVEGEGFEFVTHAMVPCGDGGICLGQAVMGAAELERMR